MGRFSRPLFKGMGTVENGRIIWEGEGDLLWLEAYGENGLRFRSSKSLHIDEALNWNLLPPTAQACPIIEVTDEKAVIQNGSIKAEVLGDGTVNYFTADGRPVLEEYWIDEREKTAIGRPARSYQAISSEAFKIDLYFKSNHGEHLHGMGQNPNDCFELKGCTVELEQKNTKCTIPFVVSSAGYGFLWNNPAIGSAEFVDNHTRWHAEAAKQIDYVIMVAATPDLMMKQYTDITGRAPRIPQWALGFWQSKLRYETQEELLEVAREYRRRNIPISVIVCDYFHWTMQGEWKFDPEKWPNPKAMVDELAEMGIRLMVSIWPTVDTRSENFPWMRSKNCLIRAERGQSMFKFSYGLCTFFDSMHPRARAFVWSRIKENYYAHGIKNFWMDEAEPSIIPYHYDNVRYYLGNGLEVSNLYPYYFSQTMFDGLTACGEKEIVNLTRCAWIGSQRLGVVVWSGDIESSFNSLRKQLKAGLNFAFSGIPWWTTDIGGFFNGDPDDEGFRELLVRWFAFGVFCPIFRIHGFRLPNKPVNKMDPTAYNHSGGPNEVWSFGAENYPILVALIQLRERLLPYLLAQMDRASAEGTPVMRPLLYDFWDDPEVYGIFDEYMFGPDILVAPVLEAGVTTRRIYLPVGASWTDPYTLKAYAGGETVQVEAGMDRIPLMLKNAAKLPILP